MIKSGKVENRQSTQGLASFCFFNQNISFFRVCFFPYKSQTSLACLFNFSPVFTDQRANSELMTLWFCFLEGESQWKYTFCKKCVIEIYKWLLKLFDCLLLSYSKSRLPSISFWNEHSSDNFWMIAYVFLIAIMTAKLENCFILFNSTYVFSSSYNFYWQLYQKNSKTVLKPRKNTDFFCLVIYLKETEPRLCSVACESLYYLGKDGNMEKKYLVWEPILRHLLYLRRHRG